MLGQDRRRCAPRRLRAIQADAGLRRGLRFRTRRQPAPPDRPRRHHPLPRRRPAQLLHRRARRPRGRRAACRGAPFSGDEWAAGADVVAERAIAGSYGEAVVHQTPLPTPGWMVLQQAALCDGVLGFSPSAERRVDRPDGPRRADARSRTASNSVAATTPVLATSSLPSGSNTNADSSMPRPIRARRSP